MNTYITFLRGINVSGKHKVRMDALQDLYRGLGYGSVKTYIQSGNVVFRSGEIDPSLLSRAITQRISERFGYTVPVIIRTLGGISAVLDKNPFSGEDFSKQYVTFLGGRPQSVLPNDEISRVKAPDEEFLVLGTEIYLFCPSGYGRTKLTNTFFERKLKVSATTRNMKTVTAVKNIAEKAEQER